VQQGYKHKPPQQLQQAIQVVKQVEPEPTVEVAKQQQQLEQHEQRQQQKLQMLKQEELISAPNTIVEGLLYVKVQICQGGVH